MAMTYHPIPPNTQQRDVFPQPITALFFDPVSDTLWTGNNSGIVTAYYTAQGIRGVTFTVGGDLAVKRIIASDSNVRASGVSSNGVGAWAKGGANKWFLRCSLLFTRQCSVLIQVTGPRALSLRSPTIPQTDMYSFPAQPVRNCSLSIRKQDTWCAGHQRCRYTHTL